MGWVCVNMNIDIHIIINMNIEHHINYHTLLDPIDALSIPC